MTTAPRPTFRDAYLVEDPGGGMPLGVVRRDRNIWRLYRLGIAADELPKEAFATRAQAGRRLLAV